jgi:hypothetical protein
MKTWMAGAITGLFIGPLVAHAASPIDITTHHYDSMRTGWNSAEPLLNPTSIKNGSFGLLKTVALDGQIDAQPLVVTGLDIAGVSHEVVYVVSENNTVYAIDTTSGSVLQQRNLGASVTAGRGGVIQCGNNSSNIGVTATPVIDRSSNSLYLIAYTSENGNPVYKIYALDLLTLADKTAPQDIEATATLIGGATYPFRAKVNRQRAALALSNDKKTVYAAFGSFCDHDVSITRGWIMAWDAKKLSLARSVVSDQRDKEPDNYYLTSIWMSGSGPAIDASGNVFFLTGNSRPKDATGIDPARTMRESAIKMSPDLSHVLDFFAPMDVLDLEAKDLDFSAGAILLIPDRDGSSAHLAVAAGKKGDMFLLDRDSLGSFDPARNHVFDTQAIGQCWCAQSYYVAGDGIGRVVSSGGAQLTSWTVQTAPKPALVKEWSASPAFTTNVFQKGFFTSISSDGVKPGTAVVWAVERPTSAPPRLTLWAFDASKGEPLASISAGNWPNTGGAANAVPIVANGKVFVASDRALMIFGFGAPVNVAAASAPFAHALSAAAPRDVVLYGSIAQLSGASLWLRTRTELVRVDLDTAERAGKTLTLVPGQAVEVVGRRQPDGIVRAEWLSYAPDSPALWKADE